MAYLAILLLCITSGVVGYFIAYLQNEKKSEESKKKSKKYNPYSSLGHFSW